MSQRNDHRPFPGDRKREQNSAYDLLRHHLEFLYSTKVHQNRLTQTLEWRQPGPAALTGRKPVRVAMKIHRTIFFLLIFFLAALPLRASFAGEDGAVFQTAETYIKGGLYLEAIGAYQETAERSDQYDVRAKAFFSIGDIYSYYLDDYDAALRYYYLVKARYAKSAFAANAYLNSGMILYERGRYQDALNQFSLYLKIYPRGARRETAEYMVEACRKETPRPGDEKRRKDVGSPIAGDAPVRVLIKGGVREARIHCDSPMEVRGLAAGAAMDQGGALTVGVSGNAIVLNGKTLTVDGFTVLPATDDGRLKLDGKAYRGTIGVKKNGNGGLDIVNALPVETYLYGVVPKEMSSGWPLEALKAQAVVARTFALYQREKNRDHPYDVSATTSSQVYGGLDAETPNSVRAVDETKGEVLFHEGRLILAYYHANSGGATEDAKNVWTADVPYLKSIRDDYSARATPGHWSYSLSLDDLSRALAGSGLDVGFIRDLVPVTVSPSGRIVKLKILHSRGEALLRCNDFRIKVDPRQLKSALFVVAKEGNRIRFEGKGYGHGVGLSQWGAYEMARQGFSYRDILTYYYSNVDVRSP